jgi:hypothetical protein
MKDRKERYKARKQGDKKGKLNNDEKKEISK